MLPKFEGKAVLKASVFWRVACLTHKLPWSLYNLITNLIGLALYMIWYIQYFGGFWSNGVGHNIETDEEHDEVYVGEGLSWLTW